MKKIVHLLTMTMLALVVVAWTAVAAAPRAESPAVSSSAGTGLPRTITVVGTGMVSLVPDVAEIRVGAEIRSDAVSEAKAEVDRQVDAILAALQGMGIDGKDVQTSHYSIHYEREPVSVVREGADAEIQGGYRVSNMLQVTARDVEKAGDVLDAAVEAGANLVHGVTFTVSDESGWQGRAREKAMADAEARAGELARLASVELGAVHSVSEVIGTFPVGMVPDGIISGAFALGELEVRTRVQVTYAIQ